MNANVPAPPREFRGILAGGDGRRPLHAAGSLATIRQFDVEPCGAQRIPQWL